MRTLHLKEFNSTIAYHWFGRGLLTIVYLTGLNMPALNSFGPVAQHAKLQGIRSVLVDYLGTGQSDHPEDFSHSMQDHAQTVADILDSEGLNNCIIVGHSMGGTVAIYLALQRPDLVAHLVVSEGNLIPGGGKATKYFSSFSEDNFAQSEFPKMLKQWRTDAANGDTQAQFLKDIWADVDFRGIHRSSCALVNLDIDFKQQYFDLSLKRSFLYGETSLAKTKGQVTPDVPAPAELENNGIDVAILTGAGHEMMQSNLDGFVDILVDILSLDTPENLNKHS